MATFTSPAEAIRQHLCDMFADYSIEVLPREMEMNEQGLKQLPRGTRVFLTRLATAPFSDTVAAARRIRQLGLIPVPHISARTIPDGSAIDEQIHELRETATVDEILLIAGQPRKPAGPYATAMDVLETGAFTRAGIKRLGVAGHPEGHPNATSRDLDAALTAKNAFARDSGIALYVVTQFFFNAAPVVAWEKHIRAAGNVLPVHPGLHGVTDIARLVRYGISCGIGPSLKTLRDRASNILDLARKQAPDTLALDLARARVEDPATHLSSIHLFPLGGFARTVTWANAMQAGKFQLHGDSLVVEQST